ncbi:MAG: hypothetical protein EBX61_05720 [Betaproteobacteria bacterium]|nr:hypothetical protein [Betaproteobacteria bacterium]
MRKATDLAKLPGSRFKTQMGKRMGLSRGLRDAVVLEKSIAHQVRGLASSVCYAKVDAWFSKVNRQQLRVAVGKVHQADIAKHWNVIRNFQIACKRRSGQSDAGSRRCTKEVEKIPLMHWLS